MSNTHHSSDALALVSTFAEANDLRLRGNAIFALAALADGGNAELSQQAEDQFVRVIGSTSGPVSDEPGRRFEARVVEAFRRLSPEKASRIISRVGDDVLKSSNSGRQVPAAGLLLSLTSAEPAWGQFGWKRLNDLSRLGGRPGFGRTALEVTWLTLVFLFLVWAFASSQLPEGWSFDDQMGLASRLIDIGVVAIVVLSVRGWLSIAGGVVPSRNAMLMDVFASAVAYAVLTMVGGNLVRGSESDAMPAFLTVLGKLGGASPVETLQLGGLGAIVGAGIRAMRWIQSVGARGKLDVTSGIARAAVALFGTTLLCQASIRAGMDDGLCAAAWAILAPSAIVGAVVDVWLQSKAPRTTFGFKQSRLVNSAVLLAAIALPIGVSFWMYSNVSAQLWADEQDRRKHIEQHNVETLDASFTISEEDGAAIVKVKDAGDYRIEFGLVSDDADGDIVRNAQAPVTIFEIDGSRTVKTSLIEFAKSTELKAPIRNYMIFKSRQGVSYQICINFGRSCRESHSVDLRDLSKMLLGGKQLPPLDFTSNPFSQEITVRVTKFATP